jgi:phosphate transport system substrate-binding protein
MLRFFIILLLLFSSTRADARDRLWIVGSSTVYPFVTSAAEHFGRRTDFRTPIVEATGTGGGIKLFCQAVETNSPDMVNASRKIKDSEVELCKKNGVNNIIPINIGLDGIAIANSVKSEHYRLTRPQLFLSMAKQVPIGGKLVDNPYTKWSDIDKSLPNHAIEIYGPPPTSGTRDAFVELVMHKACEHLPEFEAAYPDKKLRTQMCGAVREDGLFQEAGENDNLLIQKLVSNPLAMGIFGYSFLEENTDKVQGSHIDGVEPTFANVSGGIYPITRPLYIYAKGEHIGKIAGMQEFMKELTREATIGEEGYLTEKGLIPLPADKRENLRKSIGL